MGTPQPERLYTPQQVSKDELSLVPFHYETVLQMCRKGDLRTVRASNSRNASYFIPASAVTEWQQRNMHHPAGRP